MLKVKKVVEETNQASSIYFEVPSDSQGQYQFESGQYLTLKFMLDGNEHRRAYSISSTPKEEFLRVCVKRVENGLISNHIIDNLSGGEDVDVMSPTGNFVDSFESEDSYLFFAGGSGITPIISMIKFGLEKTSKANFRLIFANRDYSQIIYREELQTLASKYPNRFSIHHFLSQGNEQSENVTLGRLNRVNLVDLIDQKGITNDLYKVFVCGPQGMMDEVFAALNARDISDNQIMREYFTADKEEVESTFDGSCAMSIELDGEEHKVSWDGKQEILYNAIEAGLDAPYSCQGGVCSTCIAKVIDGKVEMGSVSGISDDEIADGYILTCCAKPASSKLRISYDE